jgi:MOSC domain-containing protein YiiM
MMRILSLNVGLPKEVPGANAMIRTGIFKSPVTGRVMLRKLNFDGDRQADLSVHGGPHKAVYLYPHEHYAWWQRELGGRDLAIGMFGENLTTQGISEDAIHLGDRLSFGGAEVVVTQPRPPCHKLGLRFQDPGMVSRFEASGRSGFYAMVTREGDVAAGDEIRVVQRDPCAVRVTDAARLFFATAFDAVDAEIARRALRVEAFPDKWKLRFQARLDA